MSVPPLWPGGLPSVCRSYMTRSPYAWKLKKPYPFLRIFHRTRSFSDSCARGPSVRIRIYSTVHVAACACRPPPLCSSIRHASGSPNGSSSMRNANRPPRCNPGFGHGHEHGSPKAWRRRTFGGIVLYSSRRSRRGGFITRPQRSPSYATQNMTQNRVMPCRMS